MLGLVVVVLLKFVMLTLVDHLPFHRYRVLTLLAMHVPMALNLKEKVWGGQFVDFAALLRDNAVFALTHDASSAMTLAVEGNQVGP